MAEARYIYSTNKNLCLTNITTDMQVNWTGVYPAVTTKFTPDDALDLDTFGLNLDAQIAAGVHGIILGGTLGEASTLTEAEKDRLLEYALKKSDGRIPVVLNIAEGSTSNAIAAAKRAVQNGADGLMVLPPMRYASDHRETVAYFLAIADATPLPVMVYNNPVDYKTEVTLPMFEELVRHPHIQAVKESTRDVSNVTRLRNAFGDDLKILCGVDTLAMESLTMGADGWVAGLRLSRGNGGRVQPREGRLARRGPGDLPLVPAPARTRPAPQTRTIHQTGRTTGRHRHRVRARTAPAPRRR